MTGINIRFQNLNEDEIEKIEQLEDTYPGHVFVDSTQYSFGGMAFYQMIITLASLDTEVQVAIIAGVAAVLVAIINRASSETPTSTNPPTVIIILDGGHTKKLTSREDIESFLDDFSPKKG